LRQVLSDSSSRVDPISHLSVLQGSHLSFADPHVGTLPAFGDTPKLLRGTDKNGRVTSPSLGPTGHEAEPPWPPPSAPISQRNTNGLAIASFAVSCTGLVLGVVLAVAPIVGIVFGFVARSQIERNPASLGQGLALAGVILGFIGAAWWIWFWSVSILTNFGGH
jgi:Domain of unknown function (DUF4190)